MPNNILNSKLGKFQSQVDTAQAELTEDDFLNRIWEHDHTLWKPDPTEITNRLGWLKIAENMKAEIPQIQALVNQLRSEGYTQALLLGMGGSSLAPDFFRTKYGIRDGYLDLAVLDSTAPEAVLAQDKRLDYAKTFFIVSTKSGGTVETLSFFKYFYNRTVDVLGEDLAGEHFAAITDPSSKLEKLAEKHGFRKTFLNDTNIGGRFSALSFFGMVPAALVGVDIGGLLDKAIEMAAKDEIGAHLGVIMSVFAKLEPVKRDKVTFIFSEEIASFGDWVEQLIAESTGKEGLGILPVVGEPLGGAEVYGEDRVFVLIKLGFDYDDERFRALEDAGHPIIRIQLDDLYDLGGQFFLWELATAAASHILGINPFDQPNVESAKELARKMVAAYTENGALPPVDSTALNREALDKFLGSAQLGDYAALQAYLPPTLENEAALQFLRLKLRDTHKLATTLGFGPRFLHSTGQLHKGDSGNGLFIQFTADPAQDAAIPDEAGKPDSSISFGTLISAQALGDGQAIQNEGRRFIRFHLGDDIIGNLTKLSQE